MIRKPYFSKVTEHTSIARLWPPPLRIKQIVNTDKGTVEGDFTQLANSCYNNIILNCTNYISEYHLKKLIIKFR